MGVFQSALYPKISWFWLSILSCARVWSGAFLPTTETIYQRLHQPHLINLRSIDDGLISGDLHSGLASQTLTTGQRPMIRSGSRSKWQEVLGFDDGYSSTQTTSISPTSPTSPASPTSPTWTTFSSPPSSPPPRASYPLLPRYITLLSTSTLDLLLRPSTSLESVNSIKPLPILPPPLLYITVQKDRDSNTSTARPDIILHSGPAKTTSIISFAKYHTVTQVTDITLCPPSPRPIIDSLWAQTNFSFPRGERERRINSTAGGGEEMKPKFKMERLCPSGSIFTTEKLSFFHTVIGASGNSFRERFEWKNSNGSLVRAVQSNWKDASGLKCVRVSTGDVVAVFAGFGTGGTDTGRGGFRTYPREGDTNADANAKGEGRGSCRVIGMFRFVGEGNGVGRERGELGAEWEVLALMSILSIVERHRRATRANPLALAG